MDSPADKLQRFIRKADLPNYVGLRRTQIYQMMKDGDFPKPIQLTDSGTRVAWLESEIADWQAARIATRATDQAERAASGSRLKKGRQAKRKKRARR